MTSRTLLVTGTSSGIGLSTAVLAASRGWDVVATVRDQGRAAALTDAATQSGVTLDVRDLDVTRADDVAALVDDVVATHGSLDALVNNAGAGLVGTAEILDLDDFRAAMEVNFFAVVAATRAALPHLRDSGGRVVTVTSVGGVVGQPFNEAYCAAKFAAEGFLESLHPVAASQGVAVTVVEPGAVATHFAGSAVADSDAMLAAAGPYEDALRAYLGRTGAVFANAQHPDGVAEVILDALERDDPPFRVQTSPVAAAFAGLKLADLDGSRVTSATRGWLG
ncbi:SDR family NAD(P)-dependent oxidoreductase [Cellulomonas sp. JH27-2]|uniref:SDR family NAD(P)-dependent oxidoreductase n=1 Tax=Cellulomonas sp. JH27-2 TaxID=2774139 RepID=UPI001782AAEF|nr:SDR family NAD(P)-dependent oxidoreductase [Cellulomonas sp. JH27-2]MBD8059917.1 SDR family NAD(P)-dependent oxidoreductase [Cellulomonas sp. JH27-2]